MHQYDTARDCHKKKPEKKGPGLSRVMKVKHNHTSKVRVMFASSRRVAGPVMTGSVFGQEV